MFAAGSGNVFLTASAAPVKSLEPCFLDCRVAQAFDSMGQPIRDRWGAVALGRTGHQALHEVKQEGMEKKGMPGSHSQAIEGRIELVKQPGRKGGLPAQSPIRKNP